jgi:hypothetical protein
MFFKGWCSFSYPLFLSHKDKVVYIKQGECLQQALITSASNTMKKIPYIRHLWSWESKALILLPLIAYILSTIPHTIVMHMRAVQQA